MLTVDRATCIVFSVDDLPIGGSDHTLHFYIFVSCSKHCVPSIILDNGSILDVYPLATSVAFGFETSNFKSSS